MVENNDFSSGTCVCVCVTEHKIIASNEQSSSRVIRQENIPILKWTDQPSQKSNFFVFLLIMNAKGDITWKAETDG